MFVRSLKNPILKPNPENYWEDLKVYNPAVLYEDNKYHLFYRSRGSDWISRIGYAVSDDGENFQRFNKPLIEPGGDRERKGLEDPRLVKIGGVYFMTFTAFDGYTARLNIATSQDMRAWKKHGKVFENWNYAKSFNWLEYFKELIKRRFRIKKDWSKAGGIFPEKINGRYWMIFGDRYLWLADSADGISWNPIPEPFLKAREGFFDSYFIEMGPPPIKTDKGWLVFYHGIDYTYTYRLGILILDLADPKKIIHRASYSIFEPLAPYELKGIVDILPGGYKKMEKMTDDKLKKFLEKMAGKQKMPRVAFCCGATAVDGILRIYYGASDSWICTATAKLDDILNSTA